MAHPRLTVALVGRPERTYVLSDEQARAVEALFAALGALDRRAASGRPIAEVLRTFAPEVATDFERPDAAGEVRLEYQHLGGLVARRKRFRFVARAAR